MKCWRRSERNFGAGISRRFRQTQDGAAAAWSIDELIEAAPTKLRILAHPHRRSPTHQSRPRIHRRRSRAADAAHRLHAVLPRRGRRRRQGHPRHDPPAPVHQGGAGLDHDAGAEQGRARAHARLRRGGAAPARSALPRGHALHRRHGLCVTEDLRHRGMAARAEHVPRDFVLLGVWRFPGPPHERALPTEGWRHRASCTRSTAPASRSAAR